MKNTTTLAIIFLTLGTAAPQAIADNSLSGKVMREHPGQQGGRTTNPTARPYDGTVSGKVMHELPSIKSGSTHNPTARPKDNSLSGRVMEDIR